MTSKTLLSETKRPPSTLELYIALDVVNNETENYSVMNVYVDKKTTDIDIRTDIGDRFNINNRSGNISITKANGNRFNINRKTRQRIKQKK